MSKIIPKEKEHLIFEIDSTVKNKFKYTWLEKSLTVKIKYDGVEQEVVEKVGDFLCKIDEAGKAKCLYCDDKLNYGGRGWPAVSDHVSTSKHRSKVTMRRKNMVLTSVASTSVESAKNLTIAPAAPNQMTPLGDQKVHSEALVLGVLAEHSLPMTMAPVIVKVARELAKDAKALNMISLDRTTAAYKMRFGLAQTFQSKTLSAIRTQPFSLNIDESTNKSNHKRVLAILVSYFSEEQRRVVVEHLQSVEVIKVDSASLYDELLKLFSTLSIPWSNLASILMDSCNVMRGSKSGLETRIRETVAQQLLDIDGDSCHHMHNACKVLCKPFGNFVENLQTDIFNDMKWSSDLRFLLEELCDILGIRFTMPRQFVSHRWLSCYDVCSSNILIMDALKIFYFGFLKPDDTTIYRDVIFDIIMQRGVSGTGTKRIREIWLELGRKKLTDDGSARKQRIVKKVVFQSKKTILIMQFYISVLALLKEYVCLFQSSQPLIHILHDKQLQIMKDFFSCYIKAEYITDKSALKLKNMNLADESIYLPDNQIFCGLEAKKILATGAQLMVTEFRANASAGFRDCGKYLQKKMPLNSSVLKAMSAMDPAARGHSVTQKALDNLGELSMHFLSPDEAASLPLETRCFQVDANLPSPEVSASTRADLWWATNVFNNEKYPALKKLSKVTFSCFHGPAVESTFNVMRDVIDFRSGRTKISSYSAIQTVKHALRSREKSATQEFEKNNVKFDRVDATMTHFFNTAASSYKREKEDKRKSREERLNILLRRRELIKSSAEAAKTARMAHHKAQKRNRKVIAKKHHAKKQKLS